MDDAKPRYVEAYPRLNLFDGGLSRFNGGYVPYPVVWFRLGTRHAGGIIILSRTEDSVILAYDFPSLPYCRGTDIAHLRLVKGSNPVDNARQYFQCEGCDKRTAMLVFAGAWTCPKCRGLRYRSQSVGSNVRRAEKLDRLEAQLGRHRPKHMRQGQYHELQQRAAELRNAIGYLRHVASAEYADVVEALWMTIKETDGLPHPDYEIVGGKIVPFVPSWTSSVTEPEPEPTLRMDPNSIL
jgi:hypothetical protein